MKKDEYVIVNSEEDDKVSCLIIEYSMHVGCATKLL